MKVAIIGGGIGGLAAAISLHEAGIDADVYEAAPAILEVGLGIALLPHAVRELDELGLSDAVAAASVEIRELVGANRFGQPVWREPCGRAAGYRWPHYAIHRSSLQAILLDAARRRLGETRLHVGHRLDAFAARGDKVVARFTGHDGGADRLEATADVLIGADGANSTVRRQLNPEEGLPIWSGRVLWRAVSARPPILGGQSQVVMAGGGQKFVAHPAGPAAPGASSLVSWVAELQLDQRAWLHVEDWNRPGRIEDVMPAFEGWTCEWIDVPDQMRGHQRLFELPIAVRDPVERWTFGRISLLGDAAHPMYPTGTHGASQAIIDARVLAHALATQRDPVRALEAYEFERRRATTDIAAAEYSNGLERRIRMVEERAPNGFTRLADVIDPDLLTRSAAAYRATARLDPEELNARPSLTPVR
jgi:2-polyprenyl-6-methoxyphenol hydroxylase-like FAD-dependent oxidoreductase